MRALTFRSALAAASATAALGALLVAAPPAQAAGPSFCDEATGDTCLYYNSGRTGGFYGASQNVVNYTSDMKFGIGNGKGLPVKNNAASVYNFHRIWNVTIYYNSNKSCAYACQSFAPKTGGNLNSQMKNNNASQGYWLPA
ncbi:peptidase inhibitor family I36 protein [Streptodolium elevatio]|uniref:Peptidase inhibitor family I36 protein n=1 Tax=Streptodolium elevatio TaxID=3157996 RepID=A0ABV3DTK6_9ACTN